MRRIAVIGNGGRGKSILARALGQHLGIPVHEVDEVQWLPGWHRAPLDEVAHILERWAADDSWVLRRVHAMRSDLVELVTKSGRAAKLVHLRSPHEMELWLGEVTRTTAKVAK